MLEKQNLSDKLSKKIIGWSIPEYDKHERKKHWYIISASVGLIFIIYSFFSGNFLFAAIIIIGALVIIIHDGREPMIINFVITDEGLIVGKNFYDYDVIKDFSIIYKPRENIKNLYFEFKNVIKPRLSIPLGSMNPLPIRENLLKYLPEDLERTDQPLSEALAKMFKL
ncbi:hypothetical protein KJ627_00285 [Patescibacteria group bacterium]|nr:hypothetical protein [Patescibacteria group bacterium]MBU2007945.1 hypothetical protein [Patescibacteria group bacterium]MBU2233288.1 hypothetical protein [Patescibacteria group bacterium]MBU2264370.1 hypothetical protein [Patescibacteria group bacterium]